jgi:protein TonB
MAMVLGSGTFARESEQRVFAYAVLASIVLHAALLFAGFPHRDAATKPNPAPGPILARLVTPRPLAAPAPVEAARSPRAEEPARSRQVAKPQPAAVPLSKAAPNAPLVPATPAPTAPSSEAPKPVAEPSSPAAPSAPASAPPSPGQVVKADAQPAPSVTADAGTLDQYRIAIYSAARRYKKYPRVALDNNWEGKVVLRMVIGANTMISSISIKTSSGHEVLDQAAIETIKKTKPLVAIPDALRGREFVLDIYFIFNLRDENA